MNILVFGATGMLGSMVSRHLSQVASFNTFGTVRSTPGPNQFLFDGASPGQPQLASLTADRKWDYWINCIGIIKPYCKDNDAAGVRNAIRVNAAFPHELAAAAKAAGVRLIQIATDCVYSGAKGSYVETDAHDALDVYGKTKSLGEVFDGSALNVRVSIIGPEVKGHLSLLDWFLAQPPGAELKGFTHHRWNGITTLRFAMLCEQIIRQGEYDNLIAEATTHHYVPADTVDKYQLLNIFQDTFGTSFRIQAVNNMGPAVDRTLATRFNRLARILPPVTVAEDVASLRQPAAGRPGA